MPGYLEIYPIEELIRDHTSKALLFHRGILNLHRLDDAGLQVLLGRLESNQLDDYGNFATLIGIACGEDAAWKRLTVLELKPLSHPMLRHPGWAETGGSALFAQQPARARLALSGGELGPEAAG